MISRPSVPTIAVVAVRIAVLATIVPRLSGCLPPPRGLDATVGKRGAVGAAAASSPPPKSDAKKPFLAGSAEGRSAAGLLPSLTGANVPVMRS